MEGTEQRRSEGRGRRVWTCPTRPQVQRRVLGVLAAREQAAVPRWLAAASIAHFSPAVWPR